MSVQEPSNRDSLNVLSEDQQGDTESLDHARLSVREEVEPTQTPKNRQTGFGGDRPDYETLEFNSGEPIRATVEKDDTRKLKTCADAVDAFEDYLDAKEDQVLVLEDQLNGDVLVLPHEHRWTAKYRKKIYARLKDGEEYMQLKYGGSGNSIPSSMITLTVDQKDEFGQWRPPVDVLEQVKDGWNKFRRVIRRETEGMDTEYMAVLEPHSTGYVHMHVVIFGAALPSLQRQVEELWVDKYNPDASKKAQDVTVSVGDGKTANLESPAEYVMKYLSKTLARDGDDDQTAKELMPDIDGFKVFSAVLWATGARHFSMSQELRRAIRAARGDDDEDEARTVTNWELVGVAHGIAPGFYEQGGDVAGEIMDYMTSDRAGKPVIRETEQGELPPECDPYTDTSTVSGGSQQDVVDEVLSVVRKNDEFGVGQVAASVCWELDVSPDRVEGVIDNLVTQGVLIDDGGTLIV